MRVGFIGVGGMGRGMAGRLLDAGHALTVIAHRNRAPVEELTQRGAREAATYRDLAEHSEAIVLCVSNSDVVERVVAELEPHLSEGVLVIDTGTSRPEDCARLAERLAARGAVFIEAPVTGGVKQAAEGSLGALVGASAAGFEAARPILEAMCQTVHFFGPPGAGNTAKLLNNFMVFGIAALVFETFERAEAAGVDWRKLYEVAICGSGDSGVLRRIVGSAIEGDFGGYVFSVEGALKDLRYFDAVARETGGPSDLSSAVRAVFDSAAADGHGARRLSELLSPELRRRADAPSEQG